MPFQSFHFSPWSCQAIHDLIHVAKLLEEYLRTKSTLKCLKPSFVLIGSIIENCRVGHGSELDITLEFKSLKGSYFQMGVNAFKIRLSKTGLMFFQGLGLNKFVKEDHSPVKSFDYEKFFTEQLEQIKAGLKDITDKSGVLYLNDADKSETMSFNLNYHYKECPTGKCKPTKEANGFNPIQHCIKCIPGVTWTSLGPCVISKWRNGQQTENLTIDLIPVFPHSSTSLELFRHLIETLFIELPPNWLKTLKVIHGHDLFFNIRFIFLIILFKAYYERDRMLPETMAIETITERRRKSPPMVAIKFQHYGDVNNTLLRPG